MEETAVSELASFREKWDGEYPKIYKSWYDNWATLSTYLKYPEAVRRLIYTANAIEGFNRQLRNVTKSKTIFPTDDSLLRMLYLAMMATSLKNGRDTVRAGDRSIPSWRYILRSARQKPVKPPKKAWMD